MDNSKNVSVGFIGLGNMGVPMAMNVLKAGYVLIVNDRNPEAAKSLLEAGAVWAGTAREVAERTEVVFTCLPSLKVIEDVALGENGILAGIRAGSAFFETSTNAPELLDKLHAAFAKKGAHVLDAPVSGGAYGARSGQLAMWVGGDKGAFDRYEPVLKTMSDCPIRLGEIGAGLKTKLVNNCITPTMMAAMAEVFTMGVKAGLDPLPLWRALRQGVAGRRRTFDGLGDEFLQSSYDKTTGPLRIIYKDMLIATQLGRDLGIPMRMANLAMADIQQVVSRGWVERDSRCYMVLPQEQAGVKLSVDPQDIAEAWKQDPPAPTDMKRGSGR